MNKMQVVALALTSLLAAASLAAEAPRLDSPGASSAPLTARQSISTQPIWFTDLPKAQVQAKAEGKSVLLFFHGSDWCPTCLEMQRQVFDSPEFAQYARRALILVDVDFPENKSQSDEVKRVNLALKTRFNLSEELGGGYPTLVLLNDQGGTLFQETGYAGGGLAEVLPKLQRHTEADALPTDAAYKNLSVDEFARMATDKRNVILDVRTPAEFRAGHLPGAVNLDFNAPDFEAKAASLDKTKTYLVHCASGGRSVKACEKLGRLDFPKLYNLPGGFKAWAQAGKSVEK
jgi:rhodanese-related sulfurtransferase/thioredoxin-related protein